MKSLTQIRLLILILLSVLWCVVPQTAFADHPLTGVGPNLPFGFVLGQTKHQDFLVQLAAKGGSVVDNVYGRLYLPYYAGKVDRVGVPYKAILYAKVKGLKLKYLEDVWFVFFRGTLFLVQYDFPDTSSFDRAWTSSKNGHDKLLTNAGASWESSRHIRVGMSWGGSLANPREPLYHKAWGVVVKDDRFVGKIKYDKRAACRNLAKSDIQRLRCRSYE